MKKILVGTDFSERSDRALRRAVLLAQGTAASIVLIHVIDDDQPSAIVERQRAEAENLLQKLVSPIANCTFRVILASPSAGLMQASNNENPDIIVIGQHRREVLKDVFVGTTAERTIRSASCPVLMVNAQPAAPYQNALLTTDLSTASADALRHFPSLSINAADSELLYVYDAPALQLAMHQVMSQVDQDTYINDAQAAATRELATFATAANLDKTRQLVRHNQTTTVQEILSAAATEPADLIVVSTHGRSGLAKFFLGSVTDKVLGNAIVDVLAIPPLRK